MSTVVIPPLTWFLITYGSVVISPLYCRISVFSIVNLVHIFIFIFVQLKNPTIMVKNIFINLPVKDLTKSEKFFTQLDFTFNPQFSDDNAKCLVLGDNIFAMLLKEEFFKTFTKREIVDAHKQTEVLICIDAPSREKVVELAD